MPQFIPNANPLGQAPMTGMPMPIPMAPPTQQPANFASMMTQFEKVAIDRKQQEEFDNEYGNEDYGDEFIQDQNNHQQPMPNMQ